MGRITGKIGKFINRFAMKNVLVFASSSNVINDYYKSESFKFGEMLADNNCRLIYGGGNNGLMGAVADGCLNKNGQITGVIPDFLIKYEVMHDKVDDMRIVPTMHERQRIMLELAEIVVALPGGTGTFVELFEALTWKRLGLINCPVIIINLNNYFDDVLNLLEKSVNEGFMSSNYRTMWKFVSTIEEAILEIQNPKIVDYEKYLYDTLKM